MKKETRAQIYTGLHLGFGTIAGICTMILLVYGFEKLRFPDVDNSLFTILKGYPPRLVGGTCIVAALAILVRSVHLWAKMLSGVFTYAVFGALLAVFAGGFHSRIASQQLTRLGAAVMAVLFAACALLTARLGADELDWVDRVAALSAPLLLMWAGTSNNATTGFKMVAVLIAIFAAAAAYHYIWDRSKAGAA